MKVPWYHESGHGNLLNIWSVAHLMYGMLSYHFTKSHAKGLIIHTIYESTEKYIFPIEDRDVSMTNHVGDTIMFVLGGALAQAWSSRRSRRDG